MHSRKWKGNGNYKLENHIRQHRTAFVNMTSAAQHVEYQLPNEHTRVGYLLDSIETSDVKLQAAMANVNSDEAANGKRNNFELAATFLLPSDPVASRSKKDTCTGVDISALSQVAFDEDADVSAFGAKPGRGSSGVEFRYYKRNEYDKLNKAQKKELKECRLISSRKRAAKALIVGIC